MWLPVHWHGYRVSALRGGVENSERLLHPILSMSCTLPPLALLLCDVSALGGFSIPALFNGRFLLVSCLSSLPVAEHRCVKITDFGLARLLDVGSEKFQHDGGKVSDG